MKTQPKAPKPPAPSTGKPALFAELAALYVAMPVVLTLARLRIRSFSPIPVLWIAALAVSIWLVRRRGFAPLAVLGIGRTAILERRLAVTLARAVPAAAILIALMHRLHPEWLFSFTSTHPMFWIVVMFAYPVLSVIPQGIIYRAFFRERYAALFPNPALRTLVAAACFSFCHVFFLNAWALLLTFIGGLLFWRTYEKTGSLLLANLEHALYGDLVFTIGYGAFLYHGTMALVGAPA